MIATLQSLRFVFVMLIFLSHFEYKEIAPLDAGGDCGVAFFFLLSGYVLSIRYGKCISDGTFHFTTYMKRRIMKFYPLHLLCLLAFLLVSHSAIDLPLILNGVLLQSWIPDVSYYFSGNSVSWFLSTLMFSYLVFPWVYRVQSKSLTACLLAGYAAVFLLTPYDKVGAILYVHPVVRFVDFYLGMQLARCQVKLAKTELLEWVMVALLLVSLMVYPEVDDKWRNAPLYWVVLLPFILVFAQQRGHISQLLKSKTMVWLGSISMPFFLTHQLLIGILLHRLPDMPAGLMLATCFSIILVISWVVQIIISRLMRLY